MQKMKNSNRRGFTLMEVLIVVVILGILAATVLPQFASSTANAKESALKQDLQLLRSQLQLYRFQHDGAVPNGTADNVVKQLTLVTDLSGTTAPVGTSGYPFGPYLMGQLPQNPYNAGNGLMVVTGPVSAAAVDAAAVQGSVKVGWIYSTDTGEIKANTAGKTADGIDLDKI